MAQRIEGRATWLVSRAQRRGHRILYEAFAAAGSRPYRYRLLAELAESGPMSQARVGELAGIDPSDVSTTLAELEAAGLTARAPDPADGRRKVVALTAAGRAELQRLDAVVDDVQRRFLAPLGDAEQRTFLELLARTGRDAAPDAAP